MRSGRLIDGLFVGFLIFFPIGPLFYIALGKFPILLFSLDTLQKPLFLFLLGHMKKDLHHPVAVFIEIFFKMPDLPVPLLEKLRVIQAPLGHLIALVQGVYPNNEHIFVIRTVKNGHASPGGKLTHGPPQIVVAQLLAVGLLEAVHRDALGIDGPHHMLDGAVLSSSIHGLEQNDDALLPLGIQLILELCDLLHIALGLFFDFLSLESQALGAGGGFFQRQFPAAVITVILYIHPRASFLIGRLYPMKAGKC